MNYHISFCLQAMGNGTGTFIHACVRELVFYIPFIFLLDRLFAEAGIAWALPAGEGCGALLAFWMLRRTLAKEGMLETGNTESGESPNKTTEVV